MNFLIVLISDRSDHFCCEILPIYADHLLIDWKMASKSKRHFKDPSISFTYHILAVSDLLTYKKCILINCTSFYSRFFPNSQTYIQHYQYT